MSPNSSVCSQHDDSLENASLLHRLPHTSICTLVINLQSIMSKCCKLASLIKTAKQDIIVSTENPEGKLHWFLIGWWPFMSSYQQCQSTDALHITTTILQPFYDHLSGTTRVSWYHKKHSLTHLYWLSHILYQLPPSTTIHSLLPVQFMCLTVLLHLSVSALWCTSWSCLAPSTSYSIHFFTPIIVFFLQHIPTVSQPVLL